MKDYMELPKIYFDLIREILALKDRQLKLSKKLLELSLEEKSDGGKNFVRWLEGFQKFNLDLQQYLETIGKDNIEVLLQAHAKLMVDLLKKDPRGKAVVGHDAEPLVKSLKTKIDEIRLVREQIEQIISNIKETPKPN